MGFSGVSLYTFSDPTSPPLRERKNMVNCRKFLRAFSASKTFKRLNMESTELWKSLLEYRGLEVSNKGRIRRAPSRKGKVRIFSKFPKDRDGYCRVSCQRLDGTWTSKPVHRLVAEAFVDNPEHKPAVNHIDGVRDNNVAENLEWVTPRENVWHSIKHGKRHACREVPRVGLLTDFQISQIDKLRTIYSLSQIAKLFNIEYLSIKNIARKKKKYERLDNRQPSDSNIEGSTTNSQECRAKQSETPCTGNSEDIV